MISLIVRRSSISRIDLLLLNRLLNQVFTHRSTLSRLELTYSRAGTKCKVRAQFSPQAWMQRSRSSLSLVARGLVERLAGRAEGTALFHAPVDFFRSWRRAFERISQNKGDERAESRGKWKSKRRIEENREERGITEKNTEKQRENSFAEAKGKGFYRSKRWKRGMPRGKRKVSSFHGHFPSFIASQRVSTARGA